MYVRAIGKKKGRSMDGLINYYKELSFKDRRTDQYGAHQMSGKLGCVMTRLHKNVTEPSI